MRVKELNTHVARVVLRAPDINPKNGMTSAHEVLFTIRPGWSNSGKYQHALPGGKFEQQDFPRELKWDPLLDLTVEQMILAGMKAVEREILEELKFAIVPSLLTFIDKSTNRGGWTTWAYAADLQEKPIVQVNPESAGVRWMDEQTLMKGKPRLLAGHLSIARRALIGLTSEK
jgi:hypothetical protein